MDTLHHASHSFNGNHLLLEPLDLVDDLYFDDYYEPTAEELAELSAIEDEMPRTPVPTAGHITNLGEFVEDMASFLRSQGTEAEAWLASKLDELARRAAFLGAETVEQFETRDRTLAMGTFTVRPSTRAGHYPQWDVVDGLGAVVHSGDLLDVQMFLAPKHPQVQARMIA